MSVSPRRTNYHDVTPGKRRIFSDVKPLKKHGSSNQPTSASPKRNKSEEPEIEESLLQEAASNLNKPYSYSRPLKKTIDEHVNELRKRALWCVMALIIGGVIGYRFQEEIIALLIKPLGQQLFYSSPTGGLDFLVKICFFFGFLLAIPVIIYNLFKFIEPAIPPRVRYSLWKIVIISILLAIAGAAFAYFVSLPSALYFLNTFHTEQITSLISAQEYFNFVLLYVGGFAALFQMPLIFSFLNKVTPMKPMNLIKKQRVVILGSFIIAAILTPTPDPINQALMAVPIIGLYQTSVGVVWHENRRTRKKSQRR